MNRNKRILHIINIIKSKGLELGPLTLPIVAKSKGIKVEYVDYS